MQLSIKPIIGSPYTKDLVFDKDGGKLELQFDSRMSWSELNAMFAQAAAALASKLAKPAVPTIVPANRLP